jgi:large subunit ribosomal protein L10
MKFNKEQKKQEVKRLSNQIRQAKAVIVLGYQGTKVDQMTSFRKSLSEREIDIKVVKNSLLIRALESQGYKISEELGVPLALVVSLKDEIEPAKLVVEAQKEIESLKPIFGIFEGRVVDGAYITALAKLPDREELLAKLVATIKSPISGLQNALRFNLGGLINLLKQKTNG